MIPRHAELDALKRAEELVTSGRVKKNKFDLIVIRIGRSGALCESAPCENCTKTLASSKYVKINKIYFSRADRTITKMKFSEWVQKENHHVSKGWQWLHEKNEEKKEEKCECKN